jgi:DNA polymerase III subunit delta'
LNTILSRTQLVKVHRLSDEEVANHLMNKLHLQEETAFRIAYLSEGNIQTALTLSKEESSNNFGLFSGWLRNCFANKGLLFMEISESCSKLGRENQKNFLKYGIKLMREVLMVLAGAETLVHLPANEKEFVVKFSAYINPAKTEAIINELEKAHYHIERNANPKILFLDVSLQFVKILKYNTLPQGTHYIQN